MPETDDVAQPAAPITPVVSPWISCFLGWLLPGLGHFVLGKRHRGMVFCAVVLAVFGLGLVSDGAASVIIPDQPLSVLATLDNLAIGPIELVSRYMTFGRIVYRLPAAENDPKRIYLMDRIRTRYRSPTYEYGTTYLLTAGLMNILLLLDAFDIATGRKR